MFQFTRAFSSYAVDDIAAARDFYGGTLGVAVSEEMDGYVLTLHLSEGHDTVIYAKADHRPAVFTVLNFEVEDIEAAVDALTAAGVTMERYAGFEQDEKGIARGEGPSIAWFTDPAGNILAVLQPV